MLFLVVKIMVFVLLVDEGDRCLLVMKDEEGCFEKCNSFGLQNFLRITILAERRVVVRNCGNVEKHRPSTVKWWRFLLGKQFVVVVAMGVLLSLPFFFFFFLFLFLSFLLFIYSCFALEASRALRKYHSSPLGSCENLRFSALAHVSKYLFSTISFILKTRKASRLGSTFLKTFP